MTPEGKVKEQVKKILKGYAPHVYYHMPVQNGMGKPTLDFIGCAWGRFFAIETKAPGKSLTPRQAKTGDEMAAAGGRVFFVDGGESLEWLDQWLSALVATAKLQEV